MTAGYRWIGIDSSTLHGVRAGCSTCPHQSWLCNKAAAGIASHGSSHGLSQRSNFHATLHIAHACLPTLKACVPHHISYLCGGAQCACWHSPHPLPPQWHCHCLQLCLPEWWLDSRCEMLAKCQQSGSMTVMANDTESAADVLCWCRLSRIDAHCWWNQLAAIACDPPTYWLTPHCHRRPRWRISIACIPLDALPPLHVPYEHHPQQHRNGGPTPASTYMRLSTFGRSLTSTEGSTYMRIYLYVSIYGMWIFT